MIAFLIFAAWSMGNFWQNPISRPCNSLAISIDLPLQIEEAITMDGGQNPVLTRFFHNKPLFYGTSVVQCYFEYFAPPLLFSLLSPVGFIFFIFGSYSLFNKWMSKFSKVLLFSLLLIIPVNIFRLVSNNLGMTLLILVLWLISFYGLWFFLTSRDRIKLVR